VVLKTIGTQQIFSLVNKSNSLAVSNFASIAEPGRTS
jgi:hypothetical protein